MILTCIDVDETVDIRVIHIGTTQILVMLRIISDDDNPEFSSDLFSRLLESDPLLQPHDLILPLKLDLLRHLALHLRSRRILFL